MTHSNYSEGLAFDVFMLILYAILLPKFTPMYLTWFAKEMFSPFNGK
jgi:hypothetical protein